MAQIILEEDLHEVLRLVILDHQLEFYRRTYFFQFLESIEDKFKQPQGEGQNRSLISQEQ